MKESMTTIAIYEELKSIYKKNRLTANFDPLIFIEEIKSTFLLNPNTQKACLDVFFNLPASNFVIPGASNMLTYLQDTPTITSTLWTQGVDWYQKAKVNALTKSLGISYPENHLLIRGNKIDSLQKDIFDVGFTEKNNVSIIDDRVENLQKAGSAMEQ